MVERDVRQNKPGTGPACASQAGEDPRLKGEGEMACVVARARIPQRQLDRARHVDDLHSQKDEHTSHIHDQEVHSSDQHRAEVSDSSDPMPEGL